MPIAITAQSRRPRWLNRVRKPEVDKNCSRTERGWNDTALLLISGNFLFIPLDIPFPAYVMGKYTEYAICVKDFTLLETNGHGVGIGHFGCQPRKMTGPPPW
jgi:hypothetical protein